jgi:hypothetical protein
MRRRPARRLADHGTGSATISELAAPFEMSLTAIGKHVRLLEQAQAHNHGEARSNPPMHTRTHRLQRHQKLAAATQRLTIIRTWRARRLEAHL